MSKFISIRGARVHNLKNVSVQIPKNSFTVITGLSGSGKSSLAFDTIFAEGQRRYMESLSSYARQFLELQDRPDVDEVRGLSPTVAIDQRSVSRNPRSTVGTITEIYDFIRLLFGRVGTPHCPDCKIAVTKQTETAIVKKIASKIDHGPVSVFAPLVREQKGEYRHLLQEVERAGYGAVRYDGNIIPVDELLHARLERGKKHSIDAVVFEAEKGEGPNNMEILLKRALKLTGGVVYLKTDSGKEELLSEHFSCPRCGKSLPEIEPRLFSFNSPHGACGRCTGLGITASVDPELVMPNKRLTISQGAIKPWTRIAGGGNSQGTLLSAVAAKHGFSLDVPVGDLSKKALAIVLYGTGDETYRINEREVVFTGVIPGLEAKYRETDSDYIRKEIEEYMRSELCPDCLGARLRPEVLAVTILGKSIARVVALPLREAMEFFISLISPNGKSKKKNGNLRAAQLNEDQMRVARLVVKEIVTRLEHLLKVGVDYLTLDRSANTLSGGEAQRVRLAAQLGSELSGVVYILDEPSIGLHQRDNAKLIETLKNLQKGENTVIVVEHDSATINSADYIIDVGPGAGRYGGEIVATGTAREILRNPKSLTGKYLSGKLSIPAPKEYRKGNGKYLEIKGASAFNLKNIDVKIPLGKFVCVTGVSGSGKSTLVVDILSKALSKKLYGAKDEPGAHKCLRGVENIDKVISIDQSPIGRTPRSNPATYTGVFTAIRDLYTEIPEAKLRGYDAGKFSFNVKGGGRCEECAGEGYVQIEMHFLPDVYVECKECRGKRYNSEALEIYYRGKNIADVLLLTVEEAKEFFADISAISEKLSLLHDVGLGYLQLGQPANNLSGGEAQRVKLATELSRRDTGRTIYILDEPTTGLHFDDIKRLLGVLSRLVEKGNTILLIEHNLDVIKSADWVIDIGPEGGNKGGEIVAEGTPKEVAKIAKSATGAYLKKIL